MDRFLYGSFQLFLTTQRALYSLSLFTHSHTQDITDRAYPFQLLKWLAHLGTALSFECIYCRENVMRNMKYFKCESHTPTNTQMLERYIYFSIGLLANMKLNNSGSFDLLGLVNTRKPLLFLQYFLSCSLWLLRFCSWILIFFKPWGFGVARVTRFNYVNFFVLMFSWASCRVFPTMISMWIFNI